VYLAAALGIAACSGSRLDGALGTAEDPQVGVYSIAGVHASPGTVHFTGLPWLLNSTEATGPMVITTHVGIFVMPTWTSTVTGVKPATISGAVGYSVTARHDLLAVCSVTVGASESTRQEAYASFDQTLWDVVDAASGAVLGAGASYNPSGVFFQTVTAYHAALADMGLFMLVPGCVDLTCLPLPGEEDTTDRHVPGFLPSSSNPSPTAAAESTPAAGELGAVTGRGRH
jgi:hypothetical protein